MPLPYRLCAIDLDDTLLNAAHEISPRNFHAVRGAIEKGVIVIVCSGRMHETTLKYADQLGLDTPIISYNGAMVRHPHTGEVWLDESLSLDLSRQIMEYCQKEHLQLNFYHEGTVFTAEDTHWVRLYQQRTGCRVEVVPDFLHAFHEIRPVKLLIVDTPEKTTDLRPFFQELFGDKLYIVKSMAEYLEFLPPHANKGNGLKLVAERLGVPQAEVIAFGDNDNDAPMLEWAGLGVAVANARPSTLEVADRVAPRYDEDGVAVVLEEIFELNG